MFQYSPEVWFLVDLQKRTYVAKKHAPLLLKRVERVVRLRQQLTNAVVFQNGVLTSRHSEWLILVLRDPFGRRDTLRVAFC